MDESVWSKLPVELVERVLSFSSVPDLCRFRAVSKRWNELVCKPSFHDLNNERGARNHVYFFVTRLVTRHWFRKTRHWTRMETSRRVSISFLDVDAMRWYSNPITVDEGTLLLAIDDGLMCESDDSFQKFVISDAVAKRAIRVLPNPPVLSSQPTIAMAVDPLSRSFKVVVINSVRDSSPRMFVYESQSNQWRALQNLPQAGFAWSAIIFREVLYTTFSQGQPLVWRYNLAEDVWEDPIDLGPVPGMKRPRFVVSSDRLFVLMEAWISNESVLDVREILPNCGTSRTVEQLPFSDLKNMFDELSFDFDVAYGAPCVNSEGLCKSITFVSSSSGKILCYDLESISVDVYPAFKEEVDNDFCQGKPMKLSLTFLTSQELG